MIHPGNAGFHLTRASELRPDDAVVQNNLADVILDRGQPAQALEIYRKVISLQPHRSEAHSGLGMALATLGQAGEAVAALEQALGYDPQNIQARISLGLALADLGRTLEALDHAKIIAGGREQPSFPHRSFGILLARCGATEGARVCFRAHLEKDPEDHDGVALLMAGLGNAPLPERASEKQLDAIYASRALDWDERSGGAAGYRGADLVAAMLERFTRGADALDIADAGCGTGLVGGLVAAKARRLVGIDASVPMLARAKDRSVYHDLQSGDLVAFLNAHPERFDAVTCAATLIHFGDLRAAFQGAAKSLRDGGLFVLTLFPNENDEDAVGVGSLDGFAQHGCFVHGRNYVAQLAQATGFEVAALETDVHEYHQGKPKMGLVAALRRAGRQRSQASAA